jgi:cytochrome c oxidase cbb3-type subunit 3
MSDFFNIGWSVYIAAIVIGVSSSAWLADHRQPPKVMADDNSTGHVWDEDLKEMNNPLPRWWMGLFVITVVFAAVYLALYPGLGSNKGTLQWTAVGQLQAENEKARTAMAPVYASFANWRPPIWPRTPGHGHRRAPVREQLRAVPRLGRAAARASPT